MANRKMRCNKTKMKMMRLVGEVLEKKMPSKYQEFQMLGIKDTEYSLSLIHISEPTRRV